jgi:hypothetical protein
MALKDIQDVKDDKREAARPLTNHPNPDVHVTNEVGIFGQTGPVAVVDTVVVPGPVGVTGPPGPVYVAGVTAIHDKPWFNDESKGPPTSFPSPPF